MSILPGTKRALRRLALKRRPPMRRYTYTLIMNIRMDLASGTYSPDCDWTRMRQGWVGEGSSHCKIPHQGNLIWTRLRQGRAKEGNGRCICVFPPRQAFIATVSGFHGREPEQGAGGEIIQTSRQADGHAIRLPCRVGPGPSRQGVWRGRHCWRRIVRTFNPHNAS